MSSNLSLKIRSLIEEKNLSVQGLEKKSGLKLNAVRNILIGHSKKPSAETLLAISRALGCSIGELLDEEISQKHSKNVLQEFDFKNVDLFEKVTLYLIDFYRNNDIVIENIKFHEDLLHVYKYLEENNKSVFDERFCKWYLMRDLD
jgi:transcriptional regulator with XRE-family HTH domain